jgi:multidrug efflux pump subunit AcrA (membrane-fusion protein)
MRSIHRSFLIFVILIAALAGTFQEPFRPVWINSPREGTLLFVATPVSKRETIPDREKVTTSAGIFRRLHVGDSVQKGRIVAQLDTRIAEQDLKVANAKLKLAEAELTVAQKDQEDAKRRFDVQKRLKDTLDGIQTEDLKGSEIMWKRSIAEVKSKQAAIEVAQLEIERCRLISSYTIRSPENGKIKSIRKQSGDPVSNGELIIELEVTKGRD